jgi:hypothetical protein
MSSASHPAPDETLALDDPGDETARRYRFQCTYAAITCCLLLDDMEDVIEIFCEQHEDVLLKHRDGRFSGHQVKTRDTDQPVWKSGDEQVKSAFARFVKLDVEYPSYFRAFQFLTNHPLYNAENAQSPQYLLKNIAAAPTLGDLKTPVLRWLRLIANRADTTEIAAFHALKKATARDDLPKLQDSLIRLMETLAASWREAEDYSHASIRRAARALVSKCASASSLDHEQLLPAYIIAISNPGATVEARINGKRLSAAEVKSILSSSINTAADLVGAPERQTEPGQGSTDLLLKKLDAGGFAMVSQNSAEDLRDKADYLGIAWTKKQGRQRGLERYDHIRSLALSDAASAFESARIDGAQFGPAMRQNLRRLFQERRARGEQLFDCTDEHLEGVVYSLTAECLVQWSIDRPWEVV